MTATIKPEPVIALTSETVTHNAPTVATPASACVVGRAKPIVYSIVTGAALALCGCEAAALLATPDSGLGRWQARKDAEQARGAVSASRRAGPCFSAPSQCIGQAHEAERRYQEPPLRALEAQTFCDIMLTTLPLATAAGQFDLAKSTRRLVNVCYEKGGVPLSEALACSDSLESADQAAAAAIERYSDVTVPLMAGMTPEQVVEFTRATSAALDGRLPFGRSYTCVKGGGQ